MLSPSMLWIVSAVNIDYKPIRIMEKKKLGASAKTSLALAIQVDV